MAGRTILIVEDQEHLRQMTAAVLERHGFNVFQAGDASEATQIWEREKSSIDLLFADILIPGLSGPEIAREFLLTKPDLKVIFSSGNSSKTVLETTQLIQGATFMRKPYPIGTLISAVNACFHAA
jgi:two-component system cell cycle sensor histidine kinase/response regulator CckA